MRALAFLPQFIVADPTGQVAALFQFAQLGYSIQSLGAIQNWNWIPTNQVVNGHDCQTVLHGLAHQHAVKWVTMNWREMGKLGHAGFV